jgi:hypothetical protein
MAQPQHDACFVVEGKRLYAERAVLCARSTFFAGMFGSSMKGSSRGLSSSFLFFSLLF